MGSTNFLQWNPAKVNQQTDAEFLADSQRTGGAVDNTEFSAELANKLFYQVTTFTDAFCQMMANKGYDVSDADLSVLTAVLANVITDADQLLPISTVTYSPTPNFNAAVSNGFQMPLVGNVTASTISGGTPGQLIAHYFSQDSVGGRTVVWPTSYVGAVQPDPTPNAVSLLLFRLDSAGVPRAVGPLMSNNGAFFAGYVFASTPPAADNSTKLATTAWSLIGFAISVGTNGYIKLPTWLGGLVLQWGFQTSTNNTFNFPLAFPNACFVFLPCNTTSQGSFVDNAYGAATSLSQFFLATKDSQGGISNFPCSWFAIGN